MGQPPDRLVDAFNPNPSREKGVGAVPVTMGSPSFSRREFGSCRITEAWFPPEHTLPFHHHERAVLAVMLEGGFEDVFRSTTLECSEGTVLIEPGGESHENRIGSAGARVLVMQPDPSDAPLREVCATGLDRIDAFRLPRLHLVARRLSHELRHPDLVSGLAGEALTLEALSLIARRVASRSSDARPAWLDKVHDLIRHRFRESLTIADLSAEVGIHGSHIARVFKDEYGVTVGSYVRQLRLQWAADRIADGVEDLSRIAFQAGYCDQSHMTRAFKARFGVTPGAYRELKS